MNIGENIKNIRKAHGMEQAELAEKLHISNKTVSSWECGRTEPKIGMIEAMCKIFDCDKSAFLDGVEAKPPEHLMKYMQMISSLNKEQQESVIKYIEFLKSSDPQK